MSAEPNVVEFDAAAAFLARLPQETRLNVARLLLQELAASERDSHPFTDDLCGSDVEECREAFYPLIRASQDEGDSKALAVICTWLVMHADKKLLTGLMYFIEHEEDEPRGLHLVTEQSEETI